MQRIASFIALASITTAASAQLGTVSGPLINWQPMAITYNGPQASEWDAVNPFTDYRLQVLFTAPSGRTFDVPGYFAGDGSTDGSNTGTGNAWRVRFSPDEAGQWSAVASFRTGADVATAVLSDEEPDPAAGTATAFDGDTVTFNIAPEDTSAPGTLGKGKLLYNGTHFLTFADGTPFIKTGADSPENWLGYYGFDNTRSANSRGPNTPDRLHRFPTHEADWQPGDPNWDSPDTPEPNDGRRIIGAINYLESVGVNAIYFLPMNIGGDGQDSWPYADPPPGLPGTQPIDGSGDPDNDNTRFDLSKLDQWQLFFSHVQAKGLQIHFVMAEAEGPNKRELDGYDASGNNIQPDLGPERRLFYREMIARFGHHNAIQWNISEEYNLSLNIGSARVLDYARSLKALDPYGTPVTVHNAGNPANTNNGPWAPFIGQPDIDVTSLQDARRADGWGQIVTDYRDASAAAGKPIPVMIDEPASPTRDVADFDDFRKRVIYDVLFAGGGGEWFINNLDQSLEDFREFEKIWTEAATAREFIEANLPPSGFEPARDLVTGEAGTFGGAELLRSTTGNATFAIYFPDASDTGELNLAASPGVHRLRWFNPRSGTYAGPMISIDGGGMAALPSPPSDADEDWVAIVRAGGPRVLFVRGADRSGGFLEAGNDTQRTEQLADITNAQTFGGNHGWAELDSALTAAGFQTEQIIEPLAPTDPPIGPTEGAPVPFDAMELSDYAAIVLGSNNARYTASQADAIESYIRSGGGVLFISDANFGGSWDDAPTSDQAFLDRFGWTMQQDRGTYQLARADDDFIVPDHPILTGVDRFDGEGVSPVVVPTTDLPGVSSTLIVRAKPGNQTRNNDGNPGTNRAVTPDDATLAIGLAGTGRFAVHFDRNTFFNQNGAGTNINRFDNRTYALNLFTWLSSAATTPPDDPDPVDPDDCNDNGLDDAIELAAIGTGGLVGTYYDGLDFSGERRARIDTTVEFDWGAGAPFGDWDGNTFSCRWTGFVRTEAAGQYGFSTVTNDGARLFVDGTQLVDEWIDQSPTEHSGTITLPADTLVRIRMEHYEGQGTAVAELRWTPPGETTSSVIPQSNLVPARDDDRDGTLDDCDDCVNAADVNRDGLLDIDDFTGFVTGFFAGELATDVNGDGLLDIDDFSEFVSRFFEGCTLA
ncbi:MAG: PA14 domain-containing protein [Planctomycetota bacterium]